jgi:hypothetical protein
MDALSSIFTWLSDHEAGISAVVGITVLAGVVFAGLRWLLLRGTAGTPEKPLARPRRRTVLIAASATVLLGFMGVVAWLVWPDDATREVAPGGDPGDLEDNSIGRSLFERAIELDPERPSAFAGLAFTHYNDILYQWTDSPARSLDEQFQAARTCVKLDLILPATSIWLGLLVSMARATRRLRPPISPFSSLRVMQGDSLHLVCSLR